ncbi:MAG: 16S rRNA (cytosine(1402)-N(4))-methyltransferase RsmH [Propionibacteriales bacterium]|nr:16S rRNA (cytosine(1402)-N(4))-methyltransferase RsmH [Propionibacteriales bacterium]
MTAAEHVPVMLERVVALVAPSLVRPGSVLVDATLGLGGHTAAVLQACPTARVVGVDRDPDALESSRSRLADFAERLTFVHAVYDELPGVLDRLGLRRVQGVLFDLGISSMQVDRPARGFSYAQDSPLDMRMDPSRGSTAADVLNTYPVHELARVIREYGEERFARRIAESIVRERERRPFESSARLVEVVAAAIPASARRSGHPAKRIFQALRIEVNDEIAVLGRALPAAIDALAVGGRVVVLSYHSLEDRLVKQTFAARSSSRVPPDLPVVPAGYEPELRLVTRGAERASEEEIARNPRAASVRLRVAERVREAA